MCEPSILDGNHLAKFTIPYKLSCSISIFACPLFPCPDKKCTALDMAKEKIYSGRYDLVVLDEINYAIDTLDFQLIALKDILEIIKRKPAGTHLILTGRNAKPEVIEKADLVTEMKEIKHPFQKGIQAQKGIDY